MILKLLRKQRNLTQQELADDLGVAKSTICLYEKESREPDNAMLQRIADYFGVSVDYLLGREEKRHSVQVPDKYKDIMVALNDGDKNLQQEDIDAIVRFIEFTKNK